MPLRPTSKSPRAAAASMLVKPTWTKRGVRPRLDASNCATSTSKPTTCEGSFGSASTYGAPPSASPPQRSSAGAFARTADEASARHTNTVNRFKVTGCRGQVTGNSDRIETDRRELSGGHDDVDFRREAVARVDPKDESLRPSRP